MDVLQEAEWPDEFTREEMLEQQSHLLVEECHLLQKELSLGGYHPAYDPCGHHRLGHASTTNRYTKASLHD